MQIDPSDWGWEVKGDVFFPILLEPASEELLKIVRCKCIKIIMKKNASANCYQKKHATQTYVPVGEMV